MSAVERGRRRLTFEGLAGDQPAPQRDWDGGPLTLTFADRAPTLVHISDDVRFTAITSSLVAALESLAAMPGGPVGSYGSAINHAQSIRRFDQFLAETASLPPTAGLDRIAASHVDRFERWTRGKYALHSTVPSQDVNGLVVLLREAARQQPIDVGLRDRLRYIANGPLGTKTPLDAYDDGLVDQLRRACKREISRVVRRITVEGEQVLAAGTDPNVGGWDRVENLVWQAAHRGVLNKQLLWHNGARHHWFKAPDALNLTRARALVHPAHRDLMPFVILLILESGLEIECVRELARDCLTSPTDDGFVTIRYVKRRARGAEHKALRVRDGGRFTPGGLIRTVLRLTRRGAGLLGSDRLWVHCGHRGLVESSLRPKAGNPRTCPAAMFMREHDIVDADGQLLAVDFRRLRKSHKRSRYAQLGGSLPLFAVGHSERVAFRHYADIPALRPAHDQAIADGLGEALSAATGPRVLTGSDEAEPPDDKPFETTADPAGGGPADLWLAACSDFLDSPFAPKGQPCSAAFFNCLSCPNAVVGEHKLPAVLRFLDFMVAQRARLDADAWAARFGESYVRVTEQILPQFPRDIIDAARAMAEADADLAQLATLWTTPTEGLP